MILTIILTVIFIVIYFLNYRNTRNYVIHTISRDSSNCLKGIMAIVIVLHHLSQWSDINLLRIIFGDFGVVVVGCFFFLSGYGLISSYKIKGEAYLTGFPLKRLRKLVVPFIFVIILFQLIYKKNVDILYCFKVGNVNDILPHSWYVFCAIIFYFIFYIVFKYTSNEKRGILKILIFTMLFAGMFKVIHYSGYWWVSLFMFPIGLYVKSYEKYLIGKESKYIMYLWVIIGSLITIIYLFQIKHTGFILDNLSPLIFISSLMMINISYKPLKFLGNISYEIYLVQGIAFYLLREFVTNDVYFVLLSLIFIILLSSLIKYFINKIDILIFK
ncbi:acyltransferase family protein [Prevotella sp.]|uniref:acyltransferase family protein n=1 Tax=Prevotella sp. TaxID=59823 RepID=UPI003AB7C40E